MVNQLDISAESLRTFENFYQKRVSEAGGAREDHEELEIAKDILAAVVNDGLTPTADGAAKTDARKAPVTDLTSDQRGANLCV